METKSKEQQCTKSENANFNRNTKNTNKANIDNSKGDAKRGGSMKIAPPASSKTKTK